MKKEVWMLADSIVTPLGSTTAETFAKLRAGISGLRLIENNALSDSPIYGGIIEERAHDGSSKFELLCQQVIEKLVGKVRVQTDRTIFILSTTKGNISLLEEGQSHNPRIHLHETASYLSKLYGFKHQLVISNACISGVMALLIGKRFIESGRFDNAVVVGADVLSRFVISGFQSLQALSPEQCRPFDAKRKGINLGECAAGVVLGTKTDLIGHKSAVRIAGGGMTNDANHISGPSRTGEELALAISQALEESETGISEVDFVCSHGTATQYNDETESKAINIMNMQHVPLNSLKGYFGHTLGAAGLLETILSAECLKQNELIGTIGFDQLGVTQPITVIKDHSYQQVNTCLKTASGFGGCNAALILKKGTNRNS